MARGDDHYSYLAGVDDSSHAGLAEGGGRKFEGEATPAAGSTAWRGRYAPDT